MGKFIGNIKAASLIGVLGASLLTVGSGAAAAQSSAPPASCAPAQIVNVMKPVTPWLDWAENVAYDKKGNLWVTRVTHDVVQSYDSSGQLLASVPVRAPGAARFGPDGLLYVASGDFPPTNMIPGSHDGTVVRFNPAEQNPRIETFATGFGMPNGAAFDAAGNLYIGDQSVGVVRVRKDGSIDRAWSDQAKYFGANGVNVVGDALIVSVSMAGTLVRIPLDDPSQARPIATLPLGSFPDDFAVGADGSYYLATSTGTLYRIDAGDHGVCSILSGQPLASVVAVPGTTGDLMVGAVSGDLLRVRLG